MIRTFFFIVIWFAVGMGVQGAYIRNHNKPLPDDHNAIVVGAFLWPAYVAADIYRAVGPKSDEKGGAE